MYTWLRRPPLVEHLGLHQLHQAAPQRQLIQGRHGLEQLIRKRPPQDRPVAPPPCPGEPIQPRHERILRVVGMASGGRGAVSS